MTTQGAEDKTGNNEQTRLGSTPSTPDAVLAQKVIDALVADGLISDDDGAKLCADLANGKVDSGRWKIVLENQIERKAHTDDRK